MKQIYGNNFNVFFFFLKAWPMGFQLGTAWQLLKWCCWLYCPHTDWFDQSWQNGPIDKLIYALRATQTSPLDWNDILATHLATIHSELVEDKIVLMRLEFNNNLEVDTDNSVHPSIWWEGLVRHPKVHEVPISKLAMGRNITRGEAEGESSKEEQDTLLPTSPTLVSSTDLASEDNSGEGPGLKSIMSMLWKLKFLG